LPHANKHKRGFHFLPMILTYISPMDITTFHLLSTLTSFCHQCLSYFHLCQWNAKDTEKWKEHSTFTHLTPFDWDVHEIKTPLTPPQVGRYCRVAPILEHYFTLWFWVIVHGWVHSQSDLMCIWKIALQYHVKFVQCKENWNFFWKQFRKSTHTLQ